MPFSIHQKGRPGANSGGVPFAVRNTGGFGRLSGVAESKDRQMSYGRFASMIATSTAVMFGLMYLNTFALDHVWYSQTRTWMALLMGATMAIIMLSFMWSMYEKRTIKVAILAASATAFAVSLWLVRSQATVADVSYMKAMIPHPRSRC
jgi:magnesium-transporting ATPase (P-type)